MDITLLPSALNVESQKDNSFDVWQGDIADWVKPGNTNIYDAAFVRFDSLISIDSNIFLLGLSRLKNNGILSLSLVGVSIQFHFSYVEFIINKAKCLGFMFNSMCETMNGEFDLTFKRDDSVYNSGVEFFLSSDFDADCMKIFYQVFNHEITPDFWHWKYKKNNHLSLVLFVDGISCGHYGGINRLALISGEEVSACQGCDVSLLREHRGFFSKSIFKSLTSVFFNNAVSSGIEMIFGFPHVSSAKLGKRLGLYSDVFIFNDISFVRSSSGLFDDKFSCIDASDLEPIYSTMNELLIKSSQDIEIGVLVRDFTYFIGRYEEHPVFTYKYFISKDRASIFVVKAHNNLFYLMDFIGPLIDFGDLCVSFSGYIHDEYSMSLKLWATDFMVSQFFSKHEFVSSPPSGAFACGSVDNRLNFDRFFITMGDTEFM